MQTCLTTNPEHVDGGLVQLDEDSVVNLSQSEELENLTHFGGDLVDTTDAHHEGQTGLGGDIVPGMTQIERKETCKLYLYSFIVIRHI